MKQNRLRKYLRMTLVYKEGNLEYTITDKIEQEFKNWTALQSISSNIHFGLLLKCTNWSILD